MRSCDSFTVGLFVVAAQTVDFKTYFRVLLLTRLCCYVEPGHRTGSNCLTACGRLVICGQDRFYSPFPLKAGTSIQTQLNLIFIHGSCF